MRSVRFACHIKACRLLRQQESSHPVSAHGRQLRRGGKAAMQPLLTLMRQACMEFAESKLFHCHCHGLQHLKPALWSRNRQGGCLRPPPSGLEAGFHLRPKDDGSVPAGFQTAVFCLPFSCHPFPACNKLTGSS